MNLTPPSSMDFPSAAIEILVVVSGTRFRQTAIFTHPPREAWSGSGSAGAEGSKGGDWSLPHPSPLSPRPRRGRGERTSLVLCCRPTETSPPVPLSLAGEGARFHYYRVPLTDDARVCGSSILPYVRKPSRTREARGRSPSTS